MSYQFSCKIPVVSCRHDTPNNPLSNHNSSRFHSLQAYESWVIDVSRWILYHTTMERLQNHPSDNRFAYFFQWCTMITGGFVRWQWFDRQIKELMVVKLHALYLSISRQEVLTSRMTVLKSTRQYMRCLLYVWRIRSETADIVQCGSAISMSKSLSTFFLRDVKGLQESGHLKTEDSIRTFSQTTPGVATFTTVFSGPFNLSTL